MVAEFLAGGGDGVGDELLGFGVRGVAFVADTEGEDAAAGGDSDEGHVGAFGEVAEFGDAVGLGDADDVGELGEDGSCWVGAEARHDFAVEHGDELAGGAGEGEDVHVFMDHVQTGGGAEVVGEAGGAGGAVGLALLARGHFAAALCEERGDGGLSIGIEDKRVGGQLRQGGAREVAVGGAEPARENNERGELRGSPERGDKRGESIGDGDVFDGEDAAGDEGGGDALGVGVEELAEDDFVAGGDDDGARVEGEGGVGG